MSCKNLKLMQLSILINYNKIFIQLNDGNSSILINAVRGISDTKKPYEWYKFYTKIS